MFEGHDTTAAGLSWTMYELGRHPDIQDRLYEELRKADQHLGIVDRVKSVKYLDYVVKESLRLHPAVPIYGRVVDQDVSIDGKIIPKGTQVS